MYLEKAFAKHLGGYHKLVDLVAGAAQGSAQDAGSLALFQMCTGGLTYRLQRAPHGDVVWRMDLQADRSTKAYSLQKNAAIGPMATDTAFEALRTLVHQGAVLGAVPRTRDSRNAELDTRKFVQGHTYPILAAVMPSITGNFSINGTYFTHFTHFTVNPDPNPKPFEL